MAELSNQKKYYSMGGYVENKELIELESRALAVDEQARAIVIKSQEQYNAAAEFLQAIKGVQNKVRDTFKEIIAKTFAAHKEAKAQETKHLEPLLKAEAFVKNKLAIYDEEQENIRRIEEAKLQREADKKRREAEAKAEEARIAAEKARKAGDDAEAARLAAKAEKQEEKAAEIVAPVLAPRVEQPTGISFKEQWYAEVTDLMALVIAIAKGKAPITFLEANMTALNKAAGANKDTLQYPGVSFKMKRIVSSKSAK